MARKSKQEKIKSIEEQIKELEDKKKAMLDSLYTGVGKFIVNEWQCNEEETIKEVASALKEQAISLMTKDESVSENSAVNEE